MIRIDVNIKIIPKTFEEISLTLGFLMTIVGIVYKNQIAIIFALLLILIGWLEKNKKLKRVKLHLQSNFLNLQ